MYVYCNNAPIYNIDPTGEWTFSIGYNFSAYLFAGVSFSINFSIDSSFNIALQTSKANVFENASGVAIGVASLGLSATYTYTALDTLEDLNGNSLNVGASGNIAGVTVGADVISTFEGTDEFVGGSVSVGASAGTPIDVHAVGATTNTEFQCNILEKSKELLNKFEKKLIW